MNDASQILGSLFTELWQIVYTSSNYFIFGQVNWQSESISSRILKYPMYLPTVRARLFPVLMHHTQESRRPFPLICNKHCIVPTTLTQDLSSQWHPSTLHILTLKHEMMISWTCIYDSLAITRRLKSERLNVLYRPHEEASSPSSHSARTSAA